MGGEGCYVHSIDNPHSPADTVAYSRFFNPTMGITEDPATGTAAGPLMALLVADGTVPQGTHTILQGQRMGRPSRIQVTVSGQQVSISGTGLVVAEGTLHL
ncbi:PhzF family phenazine biosynthesis protein [Streptomyces sp. NBC_01764]|uniref:PhzF family phenazine biosynthesis protein n=1 Tax=Streptomyces sp. NBC_01764 TaxID=2975935 RepID=UPI0022520ACD|nr:PhzF family phenazine biosynthesis protein [Streptomyces sp. NBC_01764]MCX4404120.1 PhzF family phenazine biosynthesis protein [Streptomyces sp. NBC_01764]